MKRKRLISGVLALTTSFGLALATPNMSLAKENKTGKIKSTQSIGTKTDNIEVVGDGMLEVQPIGEYTEFLPEGFFDETYTVFTEGTTQLSHPEDEVKIEEEFDSIPVEKPEDVVKPHPFGHIYGPFVAPTSVT